MTQLYCGVVQSCSICTTCALSHVCRIANKAWSTVFGALLALLACHVDELVKLAPNASFRWPIERGVSFAGRSALLAYDVQDWSLVVGSVARNTFGVVSCIVVNAGETSRGAILAGETWLVQECSKWALLANTRGPVKLSSSVALKLAILHLSIKQRSDIACLALRLVSWVEVAALAIFRASKTSIACHVAIGWSNAVYAK